MSDESKRITAYLKNGGLFNPELADHDAVRDLLIDCRAALAAAPAQPDTHPETGEPYGTDAQEATAWRLKAENLERENAVLREALKKANSQAEHFEREWYLRGDALEALAGTAQAPSKAPEMHNIVRTAPQAIYLDIGFELGDVDPTTSFDDLTCVSWSEDDALGNGIKYIRADVTHALRTGGK